MECRGCHLPLVTRLTHRARVAAGQDGHHQPMWALVAARRTGRSRPIHDTVFQRQRPCVTRKCAQRTRVQRQGQLLKSHLRQSPLGLVSPFPITSAVVRPLLRERRDFSLYSLWNPVRFAITSLGRCVGLRGGRRVARPDIVERDVRQRNAHTMSSGSGEIIGLYERQAEAWGRIRNAALILEREWMERFVALLPSGGSVLDLGCGLGCYGDKRGRARARARRNVPEYQGGQRGVARTFGCHGDHSTPHSSLNRAR